MATKLETARRVRPAPYDYAIGVVLLIAIVGEIYFGDLGGAEWLLYISGAVQGAALVFRRIFPRSVVLVEALALTAPVLTGTPSDELTTFGLLALVLAVFALGRHAEFSGAELWKSLSAWVATLLITWLSSIIEVGISVEDLIFISLFVVAPLVFGRAIAVSQSAQQEAELLNVQLVEQSDKLREQAVQDEREHIARELHDVIAHSVSLMGLQAGAARKVLAPGNEEVERSLRSVEETGRDTLNELHRMLGVMRTMGADGALAPQPGLSALPALVERHREAGAKVELTTGDGLEGLSPGVDLASYRIIQEALTNSQRHAAESAVEVEIGAHAATILLVVVSVGAVPIDTPRHGGGHGIIGMNERAALYGGVVTADFVDGRGFVVRAELPAEYLLTATQPAAEPVASE